MPNQFSGFCYATLEDAANVDVSSSVISVSNGLASASSYSVTSSNSVDVTYYYRPFASGVTESYTLQRTYPECFDVGLINNNSGVSIGDALTVSWLIVGLWAIAFYFKTLRTGVRGY